MNKIVFLRKQCPGIFLFVTFYMLLFSCTPKSDLKPQLPEITQMSKPWTRWWWHGSAVNKADLTFNMENIHQSGIGGVEITPIYGVKGYEKQSIFLIS